MTKNDEFVAKNIFDSNQKCLENTINEITVRILIITYFISHEMTNELIFSHSM